MFLQILQEVWSKPCLLFRNRKSVKTYIVVLPKKDLMDVDNANKAEFNMTSNP